MSSIPIDHLGRDELIILLNRVAARLAILPDNPAPAGTQQTPIFYGYRSHATPNYISRSPVATNNYWRPWYEEEHDPWNAHLRSEQSAASAGATIYTRQLDAQSPSSHSFCRGAPGDLPTTTRLTDAMTYRYSLVDIQHSVHMRPQADPNSESTMERSPVESDFCDCSCTCNYCGSICCLRKRGHTVHRCLLHKIP